MAMKNEPQSRKEALERQLTGALFRHQCPPPDQLQLYSWAQLNAAQWSELDAHLAECPLCRAEVAEMAMLVPPAYREGGASSAPDSDHEVDRGGIGHLAGRLRAEVGDTLAGIRVAVARLVTPDAAAPTLTGLRAVDPATAGVIRHLYETEQYDLDLALQTSGSNHFSLAGQLLAVEAHAPVAGTYRLVPQDPRRPEQTGPIDDNGAFALAELEIDSFQLMLAVGPLRIVIPEVAPPR